MNFKEYSAYYDLLYRDKDYEAEVQYISSLIRLYNNSASKILDLGCGTGKHDYLLAKEGYEIVGIDISPEMIGIANSKRGSYKLDKEPVFHEGNLLSFKLDRKFDIVVALFHVMSYQTTNQALEQAFVNAFEHLNDQGVFIFDCWYGPGVLTDLPYRREKVLENDLYFVKRTSTPVMYPNENCVDVIFNVEITEKSTGKRSNVEESHRMRYLFCPEIEFLAEKLHFDIIRAETWIKQTPLSHSSWNAAFICKKRIK